jgi:arabinose-5-phosphate isomerase
VDRIAFRQDDLGQRLEVEFMSLDAIRGALAGEAQAILACASKLNERHSEAVEWILECAGRVITCGLGKSGHIARKTAGTFSSTGTPSLFLHAAEASHGDLGMVTAADIVLMYSHSGESDELVRLVPAIKAIGARTMLMTARPLSSVGRLADLVIDTFVDEEVCPNNLAPTSSTTVMLALSDALAVTAMLRRNFGPEDFARFHPSGALGKRLLMTVADVMRTGHDLALVKAETNAIDVMKAISEAGAGAACVVDGQDSLLGIITDGDLRRHFMNAPNPLGSAAFEMMTASPTTVSPELLAIEALEFFQNLTRKLGEMPVVEDSRVVGLLTLKDLLRTGII